ncbi:unnamed protein product [Somion occarium]|uniref:Uncharacterized protein n=1 Tax=Somion occarium TaxID=3059160 RepID=A0ABP1DD37_9APHY
MKFTNALMTFTLSLFALLGMFAAHVSALPLHEDSLEKRDVYVPPVLYPHTGTVWKSGQRHNVTWDISNPPVNITNRIGFILLRSGKFSTPVVLAHGFDILLGRIEVTVPLVLTRSDFSVVLFGDSGNFSPQFQISGLDL